MNKIQINRTFSQIKEVINFLYSIKLYSTHDFRRIG